MSAMHEKLAVDLQDVHFRWANADGDCLSLIAFSVKRGERVFVHGPSGCGKSTLLSIIAGVCVPNDGRAVVLGHAFHALRAKQRDRVRADKIGYMFQQFNLLPYLSVIDNVQLPCQLSDSRARRAASLAGSVLGHAQQLLERMGIGAQLWSRKVSALSVGQQQRVATARALIGAPELLIFDEPTSALDAGMCDDFMALVRDAADRAGCALVFVSHDERLSRQFERHVSLEALNRRSSAGVVS